MTVFNLRRFCSARCTCSSPNELLTQDVSPITAEPEVSRVLSRRCFLRTTVATTAGGLVGLGANFVAPRTAFTQTTHSPEAALKELMDGNQRYVTGTHDRS